MLNWSTTKISLWTALKNAQKCEQKDAFYAEFMVTLTEQSRRRPRGTFNGA